MNISFRRFRFVAVFLAAVFFAPILQSTPIDGIAQYIEPQENYTFQSISVPSGNFVLATIEGKETFMLDSQDKSVNDSTLINKIFIEKIYKNADFNSAIELLEIHALNFNRSRDPEEKLCRQYTGTDRFNCTDHDSCLASCYSVPVCTLMIAAEGFLPAISNWSALVYQLDGNFTSLRNQIPQISDSGSSSSARSQISSITSLASLVKGTILLKKMYEGGFEFCPISNYNATSLLEADSLLSTLSENLKALSGVGARTNSLLSNMEERMNYIEERDEKYRVLSSKILSTRQFLSSDADASLLCINSTEIISQLEDLKNFTSEMQDLGKEKKYKEMFNKENEFDSLASGLNATIQDNDDICKEMKENLKIIETKVKTLESMCSANESFQIRAAGIREELDSIGYSVGRTMNEDEVPEMLGRMSQLQDETDSLIVEITLLNQQAQNTTQSNATGNTTQVKPPEGNNICPIPFALLALALYLCRK